MKQAFPKRLIRYFSKFNARLCEYLLSMNECEDMCMLGQRKVTLNLKTDSTISK